MQVAVAYFWHLTHVVPTPTRCSLTQICPLVPPPPSAAADTIVADLKTKLADAKKDLVAANAKTEVAKTKAKNAEEEKDEAVKEKVAAEKATEAAAAEKKNWIAAALKKEKKDRVTRGDDSALIMARHLIRKKAGGGVDYGPAKALRGCYSVHKSGSLMPIPCSKKE